VVVAPRPLADTDEWLGKYGRPMHDLSSRVARLEAATVGFVTGSIFAHWASVSTKRSIPSLNHKQAPPGILILNRPSWRN
jgi:hypothetical protein